ncbi:Platelet glycoprotein Ib alpha chain [Durusdinium trenchii]|uniref:Platelet glycoprotein Ib alpha chain n=1 Tax=Durusdinium trenchii TaxID=1381693 RepID=A0ABP0IVH8_9DINO
MPWGMVKLLPMDGGSSRACRGITQGQTGQAYVTEVFLPKITTRFEISHQHLEKSQDQIQFLRRTYELGEEQDKSILRVHPGKYAEEMVEKYETRMGEVVDIPMEYLQRREPESDPEDNDVRETRFGMETFSSPPKAKDLNAPLLHLGSISGFASQISKIHAANGAFSVHVFCRTGSDNKCEPFDFLLRGMGKEHGFDSFTAVGTFETPTCKAGKPTVFDEAAQMVFGNVQCLKKQPEGCGAIKDRSTCLSSVDGRQFPGLKVENQPCVWCGGAPCNIDNGNLCEPYGFALNEKSGAFHTYFAAACEDGNVVEESISTAMARTGVVTSVDCGIPNPMWLGVSKSCGFCQAQVAEQAAASYRSCTAYCQAQGGLSCAKAFNGFMASCDLGTETTCEAVFEANSHPVCQCQPASVKEREANANFAAALPRPTEEKTVCLDVVAAGCGSLKDKLSCLSSKDGSVADYRGLKIAGEPCVWCGGGACTDHDESVLCAAYDFVANGQGLAFTSRQAITVMDVAHCKARKPPKCLLCRILSGQWVLRWICSTKSPSLRLGCFPTFAGRGSTLTL